jgi:hypothetical protein
MFLGITSSRSGPVELLAAPAVSQSAMATARFGILLADDEPVEFGDGLTW